MAGMTGTTSDLVARIAELAPDHTDAEVAAELGIPLSRARYYRQKLDIAKTPGRYSPLTRRHDELQALMAQGLPAAAIADTMGVSRRSVHEHLRRLGYVARRRTEYVLTRRSAT